MDKPILSIIVPSYKTAMFMDSCLPTFIGIEDIEVLLIDDGSPDDSLNKAKEYETKIPRLFKAIHKSNGGHGSVINFGIKLARGKYFKIVDGDDWVDTDGLTKLVAFLKNTDCDVIVNDFCQVYPNETKYIKTHNHGVEGPIENISSVNLAIHSITYKKSLFDNNRITLSEKVFYEDQEYVCLPLLYATKFFYLPFSVYMYRLGNSEQSVSSASVLKHKNDLIHVLYSVFSHYPDALKTSNGTSAQFSRSIANMLYLYITSLVNERTSVNKDTSAELYRIYKDLTEYAMLKQRINHSKIIKFCAAFHFSKLGFFLARKIKR